MDRQVIGVCHIEAAAGQQASSGYDWLFCDHLHLIEYVAPVRRCDKYKTGRQICAEGSTRWAFSQMNQGFHPLLKDVFVYHSSLSFRAMSHGPAAKTVPSKQSETHSGKCNSSHTYWFSVPSRVKRVSLLLPLRSCVRDFKYDQKKRGDVWSLLAASFRNPSFVRFVSNRRLSGNNTQPPRIQR